MYAWSSFFVGFLFPFLNELPPYQFFDTAIPRHKRHGIMGFYRACVQRHLYATGGGQYFVSKNPAFSPKIETLLEFFPERARTKASTFTTMKRWASAASRLSGSSPASLHASALTSAKRYL
jgi:hypothetical protein